MARYDWLSAYWPSFDQCCSADAGNTVVQSFLYLGRQAEQLSPGYVKKAVDKLVNDHASARHVGSGRQQAGCVYTLPAADAQLSSNQAPVAAEAPPAIRTKGAAAWGRKRTNAKPMACSAAVATMKPMA